MASIKKEIDRDLQIITINLKTKNETEFNAIVNIIQKEAGSVVVAGCPSDEDSCYEDQIFHIRKGGSTWKELEEEMKEEYAIIKRIVKDWNAGKYNQTTLVESAPVNEVETEVTAVNNTTTASVETSTDSNTTTTTQTTITAYHGSPSKFDSFNITKIGSENATSEGYGFYFTTNQQVATNYAQNGYLYTVSLNLGRVLSDKEKTLTRTEVKQFIAELHKMDGGYYLSNYGDIAYEGYDSVLRGAVRMEYEDDYNTSDVDIIASICNVYGSKEPLQILYEMFGYTHIQTLAEWNHNTNDDNMLYIVITDSAIKIENIESQVSNEPITLLHSQEMDFIYNKRQRVTGRLYDVNNNRIWIEDDNGDIRTYNMKDITDNNGSLLFPEKVELKFHHSNQVDVLNIAYLKN